MERKLIQNYTFNKTAKTITILDEQNITLDKMLSVVNATRNIVMFNFADPSLTATIVNNVITLTYDTTSMSDTDLLQIYIIDTLPKVVDNGGLFAFIRNTFRFLSYDASSQLRVALSSLPTLATVTTVAAVTQSNESFGDLGKPATGQIAANTLAKPALNNFIRS